MKIITQPIPPSVQFPVKFLLYYTRIWMIFTEKLHFHEISTFWKRSGMKSCVIFFDGYHFCTSEPGCAIFLRYTKYYTNENAGKILDHRGLRSFDLYICTYPAQYASISLIRAPYKARLSGRSACHACKH